MDNEEILALVEDLELLEREDPLAVPELVE